MDSNSEDTDSDDSDVAELDSDIENEKQLKYDRAVYRDDVKVLRSQMRGEMAPGEKRKAAPNEGLRLEFVHG